jgi:protein-S-isoprenylcysteine O-methyltransferase Ste14
MKRIAAFTYGVVCYGVFFATFLYAIAFLGNFGIERSMDAAPTGSILAAVLINLGLLVVFALQHSVMARQGFKRVWTKIVPKPVERSTYVLFSSLALILLFWLWQPIGGFVWQVDNTAAQVVIYGIYAFGWGLLLLATFLIDHFDLFGLRQVYLYLRGREYEEPKFRKPSLYQWVRHPIYVAWIIIAWATPVMTVAHLLFAAVATGYILVAIQLEERDLVSFHGADYERYRDEVPALLPFTKGRPTPDATGAA